MEGRGGGVEGNGFQTKSMGFRKPLLESLVASKAKVSVLLLMDLQSTKSTQMYLLLQWRMCTAFPPSKV